MVVLLVVLLRQVLLLHLLPVERKKLRISVRNTRKKHPSATDSLKVFKFETKSLTSIHSIHSRMP